MKRLYAKGHAILIKVKSLVAESVTPGGIVIADTRTPEQKNHAQSIGVVLDMGEDCYNDKAAPWCKIGDEVYFTNNASRAVFDTNMWGDDDIKDSVPPSLRMVRDLDIMGVFENDEVVVSKLELPKKQRG